MRSERDVMALFNDEDEFMHSSPREKFYEIAFTANNDVVRNEFDKMFEQLVVMEALLEEQYGETLEKKIKEYQYNKDIGTGVYDIHSPRVPSVDEFTSAIRDRVKVTPIDRLWINPDCGLKTRKEEETYASLKNMVEATKQVRLNL